MDGLYTIDLYKKQRKDKGEIYDFEETWMTYHWLGKHSDRFRREPTAAYIKHIFQARSEEIDHQDVVKPFLT